MKSLEKKAGICIECIIFIIEKRVLVCENYMAFVKNSFSAQYNKYRSFFYVQTFL